MHQYKIPMQLINTSNWTIVDHIDNTLYAHLDANLGTCIDLHLMFLTSDTSIKHTPYYETITIYGWHNGQVNTLQVLDAEFETIKKQFMPKSIYPNKDWTGDIPIYWNEHWDFTDTTHIMTGYSLYSMECKLNPSITASNFRFTSQTVA